jgi:excisionase family DNA binding protein
MTKSPLRPPRVEKLFLRPDEVAVLLQVSRRELRRMRARGSGPIWVTFGRIVRYIPGDVDRWLSRRSM